MFPGTGGLLWPLPQGTGSGDVPPVARSECPRRHASQWPTVAAQTQVQCKGGRRPSQSRALPQGRLRAAAEWGAWPDPPCMSCPCAVDGAQLLVGAPRRRRGRGREHGWNCEV